MPEQSCSTSLPTTDPTTALTAAGQLDGTTAEPRKKKKDKVRAAWISFVGRILAQCLGAAATVALGLMFLQRYQATTNASVTAQTTSNAGVTAPPARDRHSGDTWLAVLPFENYAADETEGHIVDAMTESLIATLSRLQGVRIVSRTSSMHYKDAKRPLPEIARELGVDWIVEGSVFRVHDRVRVVGQLIDATTDEHIWAKTYDRPFKDILALQAGLVSAIAAEVDVALHERHVRLPLSGAPRLPRPDLRTISH